MYSTYNTLNLPRAQTENTIPAYLLLSTLYAFPSNPANPQRVYPHPQPTGESERANPKYEYSTKVYLMYCIGEARHSPDTVNPDSV